tara:strand:+ start:17130 stop:17816 length:687 start_codon:yes stop_codon:yes gene_type:complete
MGDISILKSFISGTSTDAIEVAKNTYFPERHFGEQALSVINGNLEADNRDSGWDISETQIRPRSCTGSTMVAQNAPLDYNRLHFPEDSTDTGAYTAVPGASIQFYLPYDPSLVIFTWQVFVGTSLCYESGDTIDLKFNIDTEAQAGHRRFVPACRIAVGTYAELLEHSRDRIWSGSTIKTTMSAGWHNASLSIFVLDTPTVAGGFVAADLDRAVARVRNRNLKVMWFA